MKNEKDQILLKQNQIQMNLQHKKRKLHILNDYVFEEIGVIQVDLIILFYFNTFYLSNPFKRFKRVEIDDETIVNATIIKHNINEFSFDLSSIDESK